VVKKGEVEREEEKGERREEEMIICSLHYDGINML
jgi:hypothetical protein